jgi:two-component system chemotaxis response regulator CheB
LVIHIGESFSSAFADWLDGQSALRVRHARDGEPLPSVGQPGVWLAPAGFHLVAQGGRLRLSLEGQRNFCRPSVDVLFESLAPERGAETAACLLTGMGRDGADGLLALHKAGALTIAQDQSSCVVFGMPAQAIRLGAVDRILNLAGISAALAALAHSVEARRPA